MTGFKFGSLYFWASPKATARNKCFNPTFAAQPARPVRRSQPCLIRLQRHDCFVDYYYFFTDYSVLPGPARAGASCSDFPANINSYPLVIPLLIPLLFPLSGYALYHANT